jgi:outer membrane protein assembly factor BamB
VDNRFAARFGSSVLLLAASCLPVVRAAADDWPQWRGPNRDGRWNETGLVERFDRAQLPWKWRVPIGTGYCGPTVSDGRVFVMDRLIEPEERERVLCLDEQTGAQLWKHEYRCEYQRVSYTAGPRASVSIVGSRAYALGTMGNLHCLDTKSGQVIWQRDLNSDYQIRMPIWGIAAAPLVFEDLVITHIGGSDGACCVAVDRNTGDERWRALDDRAGYSAPILIRKGGVTVCVVWNGDAIAGLSATSGDVLWRLPFPSRKMPIGVPTPVVDGNRVFVSSFYDGSFMVVLGDGPREARKLWSAVGRSERNTAALQCMISTPIMRNGFIYGVDSYGELRCLDAATGQRIWEDQTATPRARWSNIHMVEQQDRVWMFNERGELLIARLSPDGFQEISRTQLLEPTTAQLSQRGGVCWSHPAFANRHIFARNDRELVCASLADE